MCEWITPDIIRANAYVLKLCEDREIQHGLPILRIVWLLSYFGARILTSFPFGEVHNSKCITRSCPTSKTITRHKVWLITFKPVSGIALGLTHPRRNKLQHGTFLRFGHPRLDIKKSISVRLLATRTKICTTDSFTVSCEDRFWASIRTQLIPRERKKCESVSVR